MGKKINPPGPAVTDCERCNSEFEYISDGVSVPVFCEECNKKGGFTAPQVPMFIYLLAEKLGMPAGQVEKMLDEAGFNEFLSEYREEVLLESA